MVETSSKVGENILLFQKNKDLFHGRDNKNDCSPKIGVSDRETDFQKFTSVCDTADVVGNSINDITFIEMNDCDKYNLEIQTKAQKCKIQVAKEVPNNE